jgi:hypothetical protein
LATIADLDVEKRKIAEAARPYYERLARRRLAPKPASN